ncbi:DNA-directed RNA polymerase subunit RPB1 [uncultured virus]|nr:DNA-directed RNA polymerase subunit RPB1 [uncultured virus]
METSKHTYKRLTDTVENITRIDFSIYSNADVLKDSAISDPNGITVQEIYAGGEPVQGGVVDKRLGVTDKVDCDTCGESALNCPGHFGHIRFEKPVFHMGFIGHLKNILSCICIRCSKLLVYKNEEEIRKLLQNKPPKQRFIDIRAICKGISHCQKENYGCGTPAHKITIDKRYGNIYLLAEPIRKASDSEDVGETKKRAPLVMTPQFCHAVVKAISDEDCRIMGFDPEKSRPEDMIIVNFPVPPVQVRPSIKMESAHSQTRDDDLTHNLVDIVKYNEAIKDTKGNGSLHESDNDNDEFMFLQLNVATFFINDKLGIPKSQLKNKKEIKSMSERLKGKEGRVRGNLMGKRVDMSGRTVITSDPNIALNDVGIPIIIAMNLTYPEIVTNYNRDYLQKLVNNGRWKYPGANFVFKSVIDREGNEAMSQYNLRYSFKPVKVDLGDIVERHLIDGDVVLFNRQPTLHKLSMMGHICRVINDPNLLTFRMNVSATGPYGADWFRLRFHFISRSRQQVAASVGVDPPVRESSVRSTSGVDQRYNYLVCDEVLQCRLLSNELVACAG